MKEKSAGRTLLMSVVMSAPGPIVVGLGLLAGRSSTQLADFLRRSAELAAILASFLTYRATRGDLSPERRARLERRANLFVGAMMVLSGIIMVLVALFFPSGDKGNVIPGLVIALLGVVANSLFFVKYTRLSRQSGNAILSVQGRLYGAKTLVDSCVSLALVTVALFPASRAAVLVDAGGSLIVAAYLVVCGVRTLLEQFPTR